MQTQSLLNISASRAGLQSVSTSEVSLTSAQVKQEPGQVVLTGEGAEEDDGLGLLDNLSAFIGLDGSKSPQDLGVNANFGGRAAVNWAYPVWEEVGLGVQLGTAINYSRNAVSVLGEIGAAEERTQNFTTVGLFESTSFGLRVGAVYDFLSEHYYNHIDVGQWRGLIGYDLTPTDEIGIWATKGDRGHGGSLAGVDLHFRPVTQGNLYYRHTWGNNVETGMWLGLAEEHGRFVLVFPGRPNIHHPLVFGSDLHVPLTDHIGLFGEANFITPNDTGTVDATLGFVFYFGGGAAHAWHNRFAPVLPVANNPTFTVDLQEQ
jgi:hypothetical protein